MNQTTEHSAEPYYIVAHAAPSLEHSRVLRQGDSFALLDPYGDVPGDDPTSAFGLFYAGARHLSRSWMTFSGKRLLLLGSHTNSDTGILRVAMTNADLLRNGQVVVPRESMHLERTAFIRDGTLQEHVRLQNFCSESIRCVLQMEFAADFADVFEVRGIKRARHGEMMKPTASTQSISFEYRGLDERTRATRIHFEKAPSQLLPGRADFNITLMPGGIFEFDFSVVCSQFAAERLPAESEDQARMRFESASRTERPLPSELQTDNALFNRWLNQSIADVRMMLTPRSGGLYPFAGVPWFSTEFGRDGIITALQTLWLDPTIARGVLTFLASTQATERNAAQVAEPGKIVHEIRRGEMAALNEVPFGKYYGSVDSTPLFVLLAAEYFDVTGDLALLTELWPSIERALKWIDVFGDADQDGFIEYRPHDDGLRNQGWKDSADCIFHQDGTLAEGSIALCEVQGYVYAAKSGAARLARMLNHSKFADQLERQATKLKKQFHQHFWSDDLGTFVVALDGAKQRCEVATSNALQCLFTGIADSHAAARMAARAFEPDFYSGWGIRTLARGQPRYNPMSYHNGSVWPHDNALIAVGLAKYGYISQAVRLLTSFHEVSTFIPLGRLPELICGFERRADEGPTLYPVACSPQAWAAGSVFLMLQAILGARVLATQNQISFSRPHVPSFLNRVRLANHSVGNAAIDVTLTSDPNGDGDAAVAVTRRVGDVRCITVS